MKHFGACFRASDVRVLNLNMPDRKHVHTDNSRFFDVRQTPEKQRVVKTCYKTRP